ncbi:MAG: peptidoglycan editing factor PgeF [Phycisphaerae bacterium]
MLQRTTHPNGVVTWQSPLLSERGVVHAFSTRIGGVSLTPFDSLNLGNPSGCEIQDANPLLEENYRRLMTAIGASHMLRAWVKQVHGRSVELLEREPENEYGETLEAEVRDRFSGQISADAIVTSVPDVLLTIRIADCVPVLIASADGKVVAAIHAGWRGVVGNVVEKAIRGMREAGAPAEAMAAAIGPCISTEHFEVGPEVAEEFTRQGLGDAVHPVPGKNPHIDLQRAVRMQLDHAGVNHVDGNGLCTFRDATDFYSHRRENGVTGRMAAVISTAGPDRT